MMNDRMMEMDEILMQCNETELLYMARSQGLAILRFGLPKEVLVSIVSGELNPPPEHLADTGYTRKKLEQFIADNWGRLRSQLPGCTGKCVSYPCSEGRHMACFSAIQYAV